MVLRQYLDGSSTAFLIKTEILHEVQKSPLLACASDDRFEGDHADFALAVDLLPFAKVLESCGDCTDFGSTSV